MKPFDAALYDDSARIYDAPTPVAVLATADVGASSRPTVRLPVVERFAPVPTYGSTKAAPIGVRPLVPIDNLTTQPVITTAIPMPADVPVAMSLSTDEPGSVSPVLLAAGAFAAWWFFFRK